MVALDIPSGLMAQTGATPGAAVEAAHTVTFIALKPGLLTGKARDVVGVLHLRDALGLDASGSAEACARFIAYAFWQRSCRAGCRRAGPPRIRAITAGWCVGGDRGTAGAIRMTGGSGAAQRCRISASAHSH